MQAAQCYETAFFARRFEDDGSLTTVTQYGSCVVLDPITADILLGMEARQTPHRILQSISERCGCTSVEAQCFYERAVNGLALAGFFVE